MGDLEKMKAGLWLHAICPEIGGALLRTEELVFRLNQLPPTRREEREAIIRQLFGHVGESVCIHSPFHCDFGEQISVGDHFVGNYNLTILDEAPSPSATMSSSGRMSASTPSTTPCCPTSATQASCARCPSPSATTSGSEATRS